jgi:hypothetical protein
MLHSPIAGENTFDQRPIFCNGRLLYIHSSLWQQLSWNIPVEDKNVYHQYDATSIYGGKESAIFWADAICMNQRETTEKNHHTPLMRTIYRDADQVI